MQLRTLLTFVNFGMIGLAVVVLLAYPQWAGDAFYLLLGWMFGSFVLIYSPWGARPVGGSTATPSISVSPDAPLSASSGHEHASSIGFCMYCAAPLEPGTARCPSCGRSLPHFS
jgi:hypothetical protein